MFVDLSISLQEKEFKNKMSRLIYGRSQSPNVAVAASVPASTTIHKILLVHMDN